MISKYIGINISTDLRKRVDRFIKNERKKTGQKVGITWLVITAITDFLDRKETN